VIPVATTVTALMSFAINLVVVVIFVVASGVTPDVGWLLLVPAITVIGLLLWAPVRLAYTRPGDLDRAPDGA
jgi:ABC-type polysaccharide/polyol phosphate export permease